MAKTTTPMMLQYKKLKQNHKDSILFFRLGDFYEMFEHDAQEVSHLLDLTLTQRNGVPMCGIPFHAASNYIARLIKIGKKIAICEQTHIPKPGKGIAQREVVEIITPGTVIDEGLLEKNAHNYLLALARLKDIISLSYLDLSTAEFCATSFAVGDRQEKLKMELFRLMPREILVQESLYEEDELIRNLLSEREGIVVNRYPDWYFDLETNRDRLIRQLKVSNLKGFSLKEDSPEIISAGILLSYLEDTSKNMLLHIQNLQIYSDNTYVGLDESTQKNLELVRNLQDGSKRYTLFEVLNYTRTSMGARKLYTWILNPLMDINAIRKRHKVVSFFYKNQLLLNRLSEMLSHILDIERLSTKVAMDRAHAKDLVALKISLENSIAVAEFLFPHTEISNLFPAFTKNIKTIKDLKSLINKAIKDDPSIQLNEGNMIRKDYHPELDRLRGLKENTQAILNKYLGQEKSKTGIASLKLRYNRIIGYFLEVTKANIHLVPPYYIKRQSLVNSDRYTTEVLINHESEINSASEKIIELERELFLEIRNKVKKHVAELFEISDYISTIDVLLSFATAATIYGYICPKVAYHSSIKIKEGRHPVVEANLPGGAFVPNGINLNPASRYFVLLTGPNMAGKSTYLRQIALITLMAQIGAFVPASDAEIGIVDKIFCRVGASDNLARGESTFLVEMNETAHILRSATEKSLIIMDEVGRGTSTNDGLAIAWAVSLYILDKVNAKTLFATHFHELTKIKHEKLINLSLEVLEKKDDIVFLKRVKNGAAASSYGIHVAKLAGLPIAVLETAYKILKSFSAQEQSASQEIKLIKNNASEQPLLFPSKDLIIEQIKGLKVEELTPLKALNLLAQWQEEVLNEE